MKLSIVEKVLIFFIDTDYVSTILDILEQNSVGAGYFGRSAISPVEGIEKQRNFAICKKGKEAFLMMGIPIHPTGFFVERKTWKRGNFKKFFYESEKYGIYPHAYALGIIAAKRDVIYSPIPFYKFMYRGDNRRSRFYEKRKVKDYWWLPDVVMKTDNQLILYLSQFADDEYKEEFICRRFRHGLYRATLLYRRVEANVLDMERYGLEIRNVPQWELLLGSLKYRIVFQYILEKLQMKEDMKHQIYRIWYENIKMILNEG